MPNNTEETITITQGGTKKAVKKSMIRTIIRIAALVVLLFLGLIISSVVMKFQGWTAAAITFGVFTGLGILVFFLLGKIISPTFSFSSDFIAKAEFTGVLTRKWTVTESIAIGEFSVADVYYIELNGKTHNIGSAKQRSNWYRYDSLQINKTYKLVEVANIPGLIFNIDEIHANKVEIGTP
ncbi:MAG: hypothetical protein ABIP79_04710 [Chitinophagaceae bacterium]